EKLAAAVNDVKAAPRESPPPVDLSAINERIAGLERATRGQGAEIAQESAKATDDVPLRRVVAAALLDIMVRSGEAYTAALAAAALRNDVAEARRELKTLAPADRAAAQSWIEKADARDAALAASRQFATDAMAALARPRQ